MNAMVRGIRVAAGIVSLVLSLWGSFASLGLDTHSAKDMCLAATFILPLPLWVVSFWSIPISTVLLLLDFIGLTAVRALAISPNPQRNPFDLLGLAFLSPSVLMLVAGIMAHRTAGRRDHRTAL